MKFKHIVVSKSVLVLIISAPFFVASMTHANGYVGNSYADDMAVFTLPGGPVTAGTSILPEGDYPYDATMRPDESEVWFVGAAGDGVVIFDTTLEAVTGRLSVGGYCISVAFTKDNQYAAVSSRDTEDVTIINCSTKFIYGTITVPTSYLGAGNIALNPCSGDFYVLDWYSDNFSILDPDTWSITGTYSLGDSLWQLVVSPDGEKIFITDRGTNHVRVVDTSTFAEIIALPVGADPWGIDITPNGEWIYVANEDSHDVTVINARSLTVTVPSITLPAHGSGYPTPRDVDIDKQGIYAYVPSGDINYGTGHDYVYAIDIATNTVVHSIDIDPHRNPNVVAVAPQMIECGSPDISVSSTLTIFIVCTGFGYFILFKK